MENMSRVGQINNGFWFSYFSQSFYFSFGYFAIAKTEYEAGFLANLSNDPIDIETYS